MSPDPRAEVADKILALKNELALVRMPFAKQELNRHQGPIHAECSLVEFSRGDIFFEIEGRKIHPLTFVEGAMQVIDGIGYDDVLASIPVRRQEQQPGS